MRQTFLISITAATLGLTLGGLLHSSEPRAAAHCEVPCGIYTDHARISQMLEDTATIEKAIAQINALAGSHDSGGMNQATRWVMTKEDHATKIQHTIAQYFLTQRVKPAAPGSPDWDEYVTRVTQHHAVMVAAMKTKQSTGPGVANTLRAAITAIAGYYPDPAAHDHEHDANQNDPNRR